MSGRGVVGIGKNAEVRDSTFRRCSILGLDLQNHDSSEGGFDEGLLLSNVLIEGNTFDHCGYEYHHNRDKHEACIKIAGVKDSGSPSTDRLHSDLVFKDNEIMSWSRHALWISSFSNVTVSDNVLCNLDGQWCAATGGQIRGIMVFGNSTNVLVQNNTATDCRPSTKIDGKVYYKTPQMSASDITLSGNTFNVKIAVEDLQPAKQF